MSHVTTERASLSGVRSVVDLGPPSPGRDQTIATSPTTDTSALPTGNKNPVWIIIHNFFCCWSRRKLKPLFIFSDTGEATLRIIGVAFEDDGVYTCVATNELGSATSSASLRVLGKRCATQCDLIPLCGLVEGFMAPY